MSLTLNRSGSSRHVPTTFSAFPCGSGPDWFRFSPSSVRSRRSGAASACRAHLPPFLRDVSGSRLVLIQCSRWDAHFNTDMQTHLLVVFNVVRRSIIPRGPADIWIRSTICPRPSVTEETTLITGINGFPSVSEGRCVVHSKAQ